MVGWMVGFRALCSEKLRTPPGPEGSNGSGLCRVPRITRSPLRLRLLVLRSRENPTCGSGKARYCIRLKADYLS